MKSFFSLLVLIGIVNLFQVPVYAGPAGFWQVQQRGANSFNRKPPTLQYFKALKDYGATWVRLAYDKWPSKHRDFLMGSADHYQGLIKEDLAVLKQRLDWAHQVGLKVVIAPLSLPGSRWSQNNGDQFDDRLWSQDTYWQQSIAFWKDLASVLKDHPAVAAYNLINEPAPEKEGGLKEHDSQTNMQAWFNQQVTSHRNLPKLYELIITAIRTLDPTTPIMLDSGWYAAADGFSYWKRPIKDPYVLYAVHMYEPYSATSSPNLKRNKPYLYPGKVPFFGEKLETWNKKRVYQYLDSWIIWAKKLGISSEKLVISEFGCVRRLPHCKTYLKDVLAWLEEHHLHWAFYSFREDDWDGMDYELGTNKVNWKYWKAIESGQNDKVDRKPTELFKVITESMNKN